MCLCIVSGLKPRLLCFLCTSAKCFVLISELNLQKIQKYYITTIVSKVPNVFNRQMHPERLETSTVLIPT